MGSQKKKKKKEALAWLQGTHLIRAMDHGLLEEVSRAFVKAVGILL